MLKTNVRKYDNFKMYYWHGATLVGKYKMPQLKPLFREFNENFYPAKAGERSIYA